MGYFDDIILNGAVTEEADRKVLTTLAAKYPTLRTGIDETEAALKEWEGWKERQWDATANLPRVAVQYRTEMEAAQARVAQLESLGAGEEMTFEQMKTELANGGYIKKDDLATAITEPVRSMVNGSASGIEFFFRKTSTLPLEHFKEFGEVDPKLMDNLLDAYGKAPVGTDPRRVYDDIVAPRREAARVEAEAAREAKRKEDDANLIKATEARVRSELGMSSGSPGMPADQGGTGPAVGPIQRLQAEKIAAAEVPGKLSANTLGSITQREGLAWLQEQRGRVQ